MYCKLNELSTTEIELVELRSDKLKEFSVWITITESKSVKNHMVDKSRSLHLFIVEVVAALYHRSRGHVVGLESFQVPRACWLVPDWRIDWLKTASFGLTAWWSRLDLRGELRSFGRIESGFWRNRRSGLQVRLILFSDLDFVGLGPTERVERWGRFLHPLISFMESIYLLESNSNERISKNLKVWKWKHLIKIW